MSQWLVDSHVEFKLTIAANIINVHSAIDSMRVLNVIFGWCTIVRLSLWARQKRLARFIWNGNGLLCMHAPYIESRTLTLVLTWCRWLTSSRPNSELEVVDGSRPICMTLNNNPVDNGVESCPARYYHVRGASEEVGVHGARADVGVGSGVRWVEWGRIVGLIAHSRSVNGSYWIYSWLAWP